MDAIALSNGFQFSSVSSSRKLKLGEVADGTSRFSFNKDFSHTLTVRTNKYRRETHLWQSRAKLDSGQSEISQPTDTTKSTKQEEIIALFRHIQASISKGDPLATPLKRRSASKPSRDDYKPSTESILEVLRQSRKQDKVVGEQSSKKGVNRAFTKKEITQKEEIDQVHQLVTDFKVQRPPSNFVKRSPIRSLLITKQEVVEQGNATNDAKTKSISFEEMKVSELKEIAKSRGFKGYSKLKKKELVGLLRSSEN